MLVPGLRLGKCQPYAERPESCICHPHDNPVVVGAVGQHHAGNIYGPLPTAAAR